MSDQAKPDTWAIVELMGHMKLAGKLTEEERFGAKMGRVDIPSGDGFTTQFFGGGSVYRITLVTEAVARVVAKATSPAPVSPWDFPKPALGVKDDRRTGEGTPDFGDSEEEWSIDPDLGPAAV